MVPTMSELPNSHDPLFSEFVPLAKESGGRVWPELGDTLPLKRPLVIKERLAHFREQNLSVRIYLAELKGEVLDSSESNLREVWVASPRQAEQLLKRRSESLERWKAVSQDLSPANPCGFERVGQWACLIAIAPNGTSLIPPQLHQKAEESNRSARLPRWMRRESDQMVVSPGQGSIVISSSEDNASKCSILTDQVKPILDTLQVIHEAGYTLGGFSPQSFCIQDGTCVPRWANDLHALDATVSVASNEHMTYLGYSPPEAYGHYGARLLRQSDLYSVGMWLYYATTGVDLLHETRRPNKRLPSPRVYNALVCPELDAVIRRAISPVPRRRYQNVNQLSSALQWAVKTSAQRAKPQSTSLTVEVGHEIHVGLLKGQYNPTNQDDLFLGYQADQERGLFVVTDGVSISEYGSGDIASGYVRVAAQAAWEKLSKAENDLESEEETLSEISLLDLQKATQLSPKVLTDLLNHANRLIGEHVMESQKVFHGPPEGIMAATAVMIMFEGDQALFASMGDSRIYLIREGHMSSLMVDDDLATHLIQMGQTPTQAYQAPSSAALVNCVGEFKKSQEGVLIPVPVQPQLTSLHLLPGDTIVLCSDGIPDYGGVDEEDAEAYILSRVETAFSAPKAAFELITLANQGGGGDNLSCIVLRFHKNEDERQ